MLLSSACATVDVVAVDRHNPEAVLRAYFAAWDQGEWSAQASFLDEKYGNMAPEPVESLRIISLQEVGVPTGAERTYLVVFEIKVKGQGVSMQSGRYTWSYYLTWEAERDGWVITNYGAG